MTICRTQLPCISAWAELQTVAPYQSQTLRPRMQVQRFLLKEHKSLASAGAPCSRKPFPPTWKERDRHRPLPLSKSTKGKTYLIKSHLNMHGMLFSWGLETQRAAAHQRAWTSYVPASENRPQVPEMLNGNRYTDEQMVASSCAWLKRWPHTMNEGQTRLSVSGKSCEKQRKVYDVMRSISLHHRGFPIH
ncbi:hypothetical protein BDR22DRAFT_832324 [Usnea florida]